MIQINVDRASTIYYYPDWKKRLLHPELEGLGPATYDLSELEQWLHPDQKNMTGQEIYEYLIVHEMLGSCLGLEDCVVIQRQMNTAALRELYGETTPAFWRSVMESEYGELWVPCLGTRHGSTIWTPLKMNWAGKPALRVSAA